MHRKPRTIKLGRVRKIIKPIHPSLPEQAEIEIHDGDHLYREIRIKNELEDEHGKKVKLKEHADVDVVVEADPKATTPADNGMGQSFESLSQQCLRASRGDLQVMRGLPI